MTKKPAEYTIELQEEQPPLYMLVNPSGVRIAFSMSWRTARKIADALNTVRWQR